MVENSERRRTKMVKEVKICACLTLEIEGMWFLTTGEIK